MLLSAGTRIVTVSVSFVPSEYSTRYQHSATMLALHGFLTETVHCPSLSLSEVRHSQSSSLISIEEAGALTSAVYAVTPSFDIATEPISKALIINNIAFIFTKFPLKNLELIYYLRLAIDLVTAADEFSSRDGTDIPLASGFNGLQVHADFLHFRLVDASRRAFDFQRVAN